MVSRDSLPIISSKDLISDEVAIHVVIEKGSDIHSDTVKPVTGIAVLDPETSNKKDALEELLNMPIG